jgi:hypothetical protein
MKDYVYQLVIEFEGDELDNYDRVVALEEDLRGTLKDVLVDGHDVGQGIVNIFIHCDEPQKCFEEAMRVISGSEPGPSGAGYRRLDEDDYLRTWPNGDSSPFVLR